MKTALWILGGAAALFLAFGIGIGVGYERGVYASQWGANYYANFYGGPRSGMMLEGANVMNAHGLVGEVLQVASSAIMVKASDDDEISVLVTPSTIIRNLNQTIPVYDVEPGERITVIGSPNLWGQIQAKFIRIFEVSSSLPAGTNFN